MTAPASRRGFLLGLTTLPLIGGGVTLIGAPSAVAEPVTQHMLHEYHDWLMYERVSLIRELDGCNEARGPDALFGNAFRWHRARSEPCRDFKGQPIGDRVSSPSTRAALVLATVGCDWQEGGR